MSRYKYKKPFPKWSCDLAYVIGIIATDGNLSSDGRHINITSKDYEMIIRIKKLLKLKSKVGRKARGGSKGKRYFYLQFGDVCFYDFLVIEEIKSGIFFNSSFSNINMVFLPIKNLSFFGLL